MYVLLPDASHVSQVFRPSAAMLRVFEWLWNLEEANRWAPWALQAAVEMGLEGDLLPTEESLSELNIVSGTMLRLLQEQEAGDDRATQTVAAAAPLVPAPTVAPTSGGAAAGHNEHDAPPIVVKWSRLNTVPSPLRACTEAWVFAGEGLFVTETIAAGGLIGNYRYVNGRDGRQLTRLSRAEFKRKYPDGDVPPTHVVEYEDSNHKKWYLDAKDEGVMGKANDARCEDRQSARRVGSTTRIVARRDLAAGDEVTWNYTTADDKDAYKWGDNPEGWGYLLREVEIVVGDEWQWWAGGLREWKARAQAAAAWDRWWKECTTKEASESRSRAVLFTPTHYRARVRLRTADSDST